MKVFNNDHEHLKNARVILGGKSYAADEEGKVMLPFSTQGVLPLVLVNGDFSTLVRTKIHAENYRLNAGIYIDRESLVARQKAVVLIKPSLLLGNMSLSSGLLVNKKLIITTVNIHGISTRQRVEDLVWEANKDLSHEFTVPDDLRSVSVQFTAEIKSVVTGKMVRLEKSKAFKVNEIETTDKISGMHFTKNNDQHEIHVLDKTGVALAGQAVLIRVKHRDFKNTKSMTVQSDAKGVIKLGVLSDIQYIQARRHGGRDYRWDVSGTHQYLTSQDLHQVEGMPVVLPYVGNGRRASRDEFSLVKVSSMSGGVWPLVNISDAFNHIRVSNGYVQMVNLPEGQYALKDKITGKIFGIRILKGKSEEGYVVSKSGNLQVVNDKPLQISHVSRDKKGLTVKLGHHNVSTRVHLYLTRYQPKFDLFSQLAASGIVKPGYSTVRDNQTFYMQGRKIGDELRYILDRRLSKHYTGNMLRRPGLILNPWSIADSNAKKDVANKGEKKLLKALEGKLNAGATRIMSEGAFKDDDQLTLDYLALGSQVILNVKPDKNGVIKIPSEFLASHHMIRVVAVDHDNVVMRDLTLELKSGNFIDRRLASVLKEGKHYSEDKEISVVRKGSTAVIEGQSGSEMKIYDSLEKVFGLYSTFNRKGALDEFKFILDWDKLTKEQKQDKYSQYACHELNYYLSKKDGAFFGSVVKPHLENKMHKTFMDHYLLGNDLGYYVHGFAYQNLNIVEKILLSQVQRENKSAIARQIKELYELSPIDSNRKDWYFNTALKSGELNKILARQAGGGGGLYSDDSVADEEYDVPKLESVERTKSRLNTWNMKLGAKKSANTLEFRQLKLSGDSYGIRAAPTPNASGYLSAISNGAYDFESNMIQLSKQKRNRRRGLSVRNSLYRRVEKTKQWVENNYYHLRNREATASLIENNDFWVAYALQEIDEPFVSEYFNQCSGNFTQMMFALSVLDLPVVSPKHLTQYVKGKLNFTAADHAIILHKRLRSVQVSKLKVPILVSQNVFMLNDRYIHKNGQRLDKFITEEFLPHKVYGCQIVVTNPTSTPHEIDLLTQIPGGAIPVSNGKKINTNHITLAPYKTTSVVYYFYFPATGKFPMYGMQVTRDNEMIAFEKSREFNVVKQLSKTDTKSWQYISQYGSDDQVIDYIGANNLFRIDLPKIAFRLKNKSFFNRMVRTLNNRQHFNSLVWSYGVKHNQPIEIKRFLESRGDFTNACGYTLDSSILKIDAVERNIYQHIDFYPLINVRKHRLGKRRKIVNGTFLRQYESLMTVLSYKSKLDDADKLAVTYYLLLQDRIGEAMTMFKKVRRENIAMKMQYDYCLGYMGFFKGELGEASKVVASYKDYPVSRWRKLFVAME